MTDTIGIIGLGRIGLPVAKAYLAAGYGIAGHDVRSEALAELEAAGGKPMLTPNAVARKSSLILVLVLNDEQVSKVIGGEQGILSGASPDVTIVCMSTVNQSVIHAVSSRCKEQNIAFVDCPFTGGPARIPTHSLTLIAAGTATQLEKIRPALEVIGRIVYAGSEPGLGQAIKYCNQLLVGATHAATMEVILLAKKLGLDPDLVTKVIASGIAGSDYFRLLSESILKKTPSPGALGQMCKDISIVKNTIDKAGLNARVAAAVSEYFSAAERLGMHGGEGADLMEVVERIAMDSRA